MKTRIGNLVQEVKTGIILQQVNCQRVMRSGIAKTIKEKWPIVEQQYLKTFDGVLNKSLLGTAQVVEIVPSSLLVVNLFSQHFYGRDGKQYTSYEALNKSLFNLATYLSTRDDLVNLEIHHPTIGCGLGGGDWKVVRELIITNLGEDTTLWMLSA